MSIRQHTRQSQHTSAETVPNLLSEPSRHHIQPLAGRIDNQNLGVRDLAHADGLLGRCRGVGDTRGDAAERVASVFVLLYQQLLQYLYFCTSQPAWEFPFDLKEGVEVCWVLVRAPVGGAHTYASMRTLDI